MPIRRQSDLDARLRAAINHRVKQTSNKEVAKAIGRDAPWLTRYRTTTTQPDIPTLLALMRAAGWTLDAQLAGVYEPESELVPWLRDGLFEDAVRSLASIDDPHTRLMALNAVRLAAGLPLLEQAPESTSLRAQAAGPKSARGRRR